jgi:hypothetical protein
MLQMVCIRCRVRLPVDPFEYLCQHILRKRRCLRLQEFRELRILRGAGIPMRFVEEPRYQLRVGVGSMKEREGAHPVEDRPRIGLGRAGSAPCGPPVDCRET